MKFFYALFATLALFPSLSASSSSSSSPTTSAFLRIIQINDVYELHNFAKLKSLIDQYKTTASPSNNKNEENGGAPDLSVVICAGDFLSPSLLSSLDKGFSMVDILNEIGVDYVCFGNHETDIPKDALASRIRQSRFEWINSNMPDLNEKLQVDTPQYSELNVGPRNKRVALFGFNTDDESLYRSDAFGGTSITPIPKSAKHWSETIRDCDLLLCMTHQGIALDRKMAEEFGSQYALLMGGHDHEPFNEVVNGCHIVKAGTNAQKAAIIDIIWDSESDGASPTISVKMLDTVDFPPDPRIEERIKGYLEITKQLDAAKLFAIRDWVANDKSIFSTKNNRLGPSTGTTAFCSMLRMGLRCELCLLNAGCIRAGKQYQSDHEFTWSDLKAEIPYATKMSVCKVPGRVIQATIQHSRRWADQGIAKGGYLHVARCCVMTPDGKIETISGEPFDPDREYLTAFPHCFLTGLDNHEPFLEWAKRKDPRDIANEHAAVPAKFVLVELFSALLWLRLGNFDEIAGDDGVITKEDVQERLKELCNGNDGVSNLMLENVFAVADRDRSGTISLLEQMVVRFAATDMLNHVVTGEQLSAMAQVAKEVLGENRSQEDVDSLLKEIQR